MACRSRRMTQAFAGDDGDRAGLDEVRARLPRGLPRGLARRPRRLPSRSCPFRPLTCVVRVVGRYEPTACMSATTTNETGETRTRTETETETETEEVEERAR